jgi:hypothetical protein
LKRLLIAGLCALALACAIANCAPAACCANSAACVTSNVPDNTLSAAERAAGFRLLFDGKTLDGWDCTESNMQGWSVDKGVIDGSGHGGYLYTNERFGNFELRIDFMVDHGTNSGIFFRWANLADPVQTGIEMQVLDSAGKAIPDKHDCGAVYDVLAPSENAMKPAGQWNSVTINCRNQFIKITMNGKHIISLDLDKYTEPHKNIDGTDNKFDTAYKDVPREGHIGLQSHGAKVWYKNARIRAL